MWGYCFVVVVGNFLGDIDDIGIVFEGENFGSFDIIFVNCF